MAGRSFVTVLSIGVFLISDAGALTQRGVTPPGTVTPGQMTCAWSARKPMTPAGGLPDLPGERKDSNGDLKWVSKATLDTTGEWHLEHRVTNRASSGNLVVRWNLDVLGPTWIAGGKEDSAVGPAESATPERRPGDINYGTSGKSPDAPHYKIAQSSQNAVSGRPASVDIALTAQLAAGYRQVLVEAQPLPRQTGDAWSIQYCVALNPDQAPFFKEVTLEWTAATSPQLEAVLVKTHGDKLIRLTEKGTAQYGINVSSSPVLRDGMLIVNDAAGKRLAAAWAPAYGPPR